MLSKPTDWTPLFIYRLTCCAAALVLYLDGLLIDAAQDFPRYIHLWRWGAAIALPLTFFCLTFVSAAVRRHAGFCMLVVAFLVLTYSALVIYATNISADAALGGVMLLCGSCIIYHRISLVVANLVLGLLAFVVVAAFVENPIVSLGKFVFSLLTFAAFFFVLMLINLYLRKQIEQSEEAASAWFDHSADALIYGDVTKVAELRMNKTTFEMFETDATDLIADAVVEGVLAKETDLDRASVIQEAAAADELEGTYELKTGLGNTFWGALSLRRFTIGGQENTLVRISNISTRVAQQKALREAKLEAETAMEARTRFLANMSHEIRTPMNGVIGMTSLVLDSNLDDQQRNHIETIRASGESLLNIINEILDFSKIDADSVKLEAKSFDLETCVVESLEVFGHQANSKGLELLLDIDALTPSTYIGDATRIRQVLVNLLANAIKFTEQGHIVLRVRLGTLGAGKQTISCAVQDTGIGISHDKIKNLFDPFSQADLSTTRKFGGTGLGLTISKRLAVLMGGDITVTSEPGQGSCFTFQMQVLPDHIATSDDLCVFDKQLTALIFDAPCALPIVTKTLERLSVKVDGYDDIDAASTAFTTQEYDLIMLGTHNGHENAQQLSQVFSTEGASSRKLLMTSSSMVDEAEFDHVLHKPLRPRELIQALNTFFAPQREQTPLVQTASKEDLSELQMDEYRFLIAEDNLINQQVALHMLRKLRIQADVANNGREALDLLHRRSYDFVFMDMQMPELDGLEATRLIRKSAMAMQPYIIAMTANVMQRDRDNCTRAGMDDFLAKPIRLEDLHTALTTAKLRRYG